MLRGLLKWVGVGAITAIVLLMAAYANIEGTARRETEKRIQDALASHYAPATVAVLKREDWKHGRGDFDFGGQICFGIYVQKPSGQRERRVAMVSDGDDGGAFKFRREYRSFRRCTNDFFRG